MPKVRFIERDGSEKVIDVPVGESILEAARMHGIKISGPCGGAMACGLCCVSLDEQSFVKLPKASEAEEDLLDMVPNCSKTSRLSCQVRMTDELDGMVVTLM